MRPVFRQAAMAVEGLGYLALIIATPAVIVKGDIVYGLILIVAGVLLFTFKRMVRRHDAS